MIDIQCDEHGVAISGIRITRTRETRLYTVACGHASDGGVLARRGKCAQLQERALTREVHVVSDANTVHTRCHGQYVRRGGDCVCVSLESLCRV